MGASASAGAAASPLVLLPPHCTVNAVDSEGGTVHLAATFLGSVGGDHRDHFRVSLRCVG